MNIKSRLFGQSKSQKYPYIGKSHRTDCIVYFTGVRTGICLVPGTTNNPVMYNHTSWAEENFDPVDYPITVEFFI